MFHTQILTNALDYGMEIQEAIERPRFFMGPRSERRAGPGAAGEPRARPCARPWSARAHISGVGLVQPGGSAHSVAVLKDGVCGGAPTRAETARLWELRYAVPDSSRPPGVAVRCRPRPARPLGKHRARRDSLEQVPSATACRRGDQAEGRDLRHHDWIYEADKTPRESTAWCGLRHPQARRLQSLNLVRVLRDRAQPSIFALQTVVDGWGVRRRPAIRELSHDGLRGGARCRFDKQPSGRSP